jgi:hypothetical protein
LTLTTRPSPPPTTPPLLPTWTEITILSPLLASSLHTLWYGRGVQGNRGGWWEYPGYHHYQYENQPTLMIGRTYPLMSIKEKTRIAVAIPSRITELRIKICMRIFMKHRFRIINGEKFPG